jgi:hypothetical protein
MTRKDKLIKRLLSKPKDFTWDELRTLLAGLEFEEADTGKTGGSRRRFVNPSGVVISLHKPHPHNTLGTCVKIRCQLGGQNRHIPFGQSFRTLPERLQLF